MANWHLRFRRRLQLAPGLGINLNKNSASVSLGPRGAHLTIGPRGIRQTVGLPGSGFFLTKNEPFNQPFNVRNQGIHANRHTPTYNAPPPSGTRPTSLIFTALGGFLMGIAWVALALVALALLAGLVSH